MAWGDHQVGGKGSPTVNAAERALLEGYRMGLSSHNTSKVSGGKTGGSGRKGSGKGAKGATAGKGSAAAIGNRTCQREGCRAATNQQATWGGLLKCHCCGLSLTATLPVEQLAEWAFKQRLEKEAAKSTGPKLQASGAPPSAAAPATPQLSTEQLAAKRVDRLALLKKVGANPPSQPTLLDEVKKVFVESQVFKKKVLLPKDFESDLTDISECTTAVLESLKEESYPWETPLETPEAVLNKELSVLSSGHSVASQEAAEAALQGTRRSIAALDAPEGDPDLAILLKRQERQEKEVARLTGKKPTAKLQKLALEDIQVSYRKKVQAAVEGTERGEAKAKYRAKTRANAIAEAIAKLQAMQLFTEEKQTELTGLHNARAAAKASQALDVHALIDEKIAAIDAKRDQETPDEEMGAKTSTEEERDGATLKLLQTTAAHNLANSQQAAAWEVQGDVEEAKTRKAQAALAVAEQQRDAEKVERERVEGRLAKLEEAILRAEQREIDLVRRAVEAEDKTKATEAEVKAAVSIPPSRKGSPGRRARSRSAKHETREERDKEAFGRKSKTAAPEDMLPSFDPSSEQVPMLADMYFAFKRWSAEGADLPITMHTLESQTSLGAEAPAVLRTLLGEKILKDLNTDVDQEEQIIPRQGMTLLLHALDQIRDKLAKGGSKQAAARETKAQAVLLAMRTAQKKRPAEDTQPMPPAKQSAGSEATVAAMEAADAAELAQLNASAAKA